MSESLPASGSDPAAPPPGRARTFLGRLAAAVREQNWFAVALEICIVVLGVVIGFQVNAWGQDRADRAQEQVYLRQLAADLAETERRIVSNDASNRSGAEALATFIRAFSAVPRPPADSLFRWGWETRNIRPEGPVHGTASALVSSGDIRLIRDDALRSAITAYLDEMHVIADEVRHIRATYYQQYTEFERHFDLARAAQVALPADSLERFARADALLADTVGPGPRPYPDAATMLDNRALYGALRDLRNTRIDLGFSSERVLAATRALAAQVDAELGR